MYYALPLFGEYSIMARVTVEDCLDKVPTRYDLIILAAKRARQLATGGRRATLEWQNDKATVMALREIEAGTVTSDNINELVVDIADLEDEFSEELSAEDLPK
jgi:DNA-directed RNA polymerase subunit omega|tara:strand:+ start:63 stop:371 length:309 start_codon:yes stop_codon:yes gene_type:complete